MIDNNELVQQVNKELAITLSERITLEELYSQLAIHINQLILHNFEQLVSLLYRIDVSEAKIKTFLSRQTSENAGNIIASLIIERQIEKINSRRQARQQHDDFDEAEKW